MLHYNMLRKYTLGILSTFNDIEVEYMSSDTVTVLSKKIPIKFSSREKAKLFDEHTTEQLLSGNTNVLPRMSLVLSTMVRAEMRTPNKFTKHNVNEVGDDITFNHAPVPYEFTYELIVQCRGMNEASMIIEQIAPRFNPNYTLRINEVPNAGEATSVPISLLDIGMESEEYEEVSTNIITLSMGLSLKGNLYPPLQTTSKVKNLQIFNNLWAEDEFQRASLIEWDVIDGIVTPPPTTTVFELGKEAPIISDILVSSIPVLDGDTAELTVVFTDKDNKISDGPWIYVWSVIQGDATITTGAETVTLTVNTILPVSTVVQVTIIDIHGNQSLPYQEMIVDTSGANIEDTTTTVLYDDTNISTEFVV